MPLERLLLIAKAAGIATFALFLAECSQPKTSNVLPSIQDVDRLESKISTHPCVGELSAWERNYRIAKGRHVFLPRSALKDVDVIEFHYRHIGPVTISGARNLLPPSVNGDWPDNRSIRTIDGSFVISSGELHVTPCAPL